MRLNLELDGQETEELIDLIRELKEVLDDVRESLCVHTLQEDSVQGESKR
jgi:hypothetical protein